MNRVKRTFGIALASAAVCVLLFAPALAAWPLQQDAKTKYAELLGDYEFDLADLGMGIIVMNFYVEGDSLWGWPETSSDPAELIPVEGETFKFYIEDDQEGRYDVVFLKDEQGKYTKCRVVNEGMGLDSTGTKTEK